jgi:hypothetical protein
MRLVACLCAVLSLLAASLVSVGCAGEESTPTTMPRLFKADFEDGKLDAWQPTDPAAWKIDEAAGNKFLSLFKGSKYNPTVRSPLNYNLIKDVIVGDFVLEAKMLSTAREYGHRDMDVVFGYQDPRHFYYAHIAPAPKTDPNANSIFIVDDKPRVSVADLRNDGNKWDDKWHTVRVVRNVAKGTIEVYRDDMKTAIMTATNDRFKWGQVGVGTFDDPGNYDDIKLWGAKAEKGK